MNSPPTASRIEVSGWDEDEMFFVEKSEFSYSEASGKHITLQHNLADGSLIFLRVIHTSIPLNAIPVAYRVHPLGFDSQGLFQFSLAPAQPLNALPAIRYINEQFPTVSAQWPISALALPLLFHF
jgi:hypothetical protein